jgi:hypothetical protein
MFPFLKIEFFKTAAARVEAKSWMDVVLHNRYAGEINEYLKQGSININGDHNVSSVEQLFQHNFGLPVQVFRKQKKLWVGANETHELTLNEQNEIGKESCGQHIFAEMAEV